MRTLPKSGALLLSLAAAAVLLTAPASSAATERVSTKHYVGAPTSAGLVFCGDPRPVADGVGRACHNLRAGDAVISVAIADTTGQRVAGRIVFFGRETGIGEPLDIVGATTFCNQTSNVAIPAGATHLDIEIGDRLDSAVRPCGFITAGTYGTVTTRIS